MKPESSQLLDAAQELLDEARAILASNIVGQAGRSAYSAALLAARADIFELTGVAAKTHRGTHNTFFRLTAEEPRIETEFRLFLSRPYDLKDAVDYRTSPARNITPEQAAEALETPTRFVARVTGILAAS